MPAAGVMSNAPHRKPVPAQRPFNNFPQSHPHQAQASYTENFSMPRAPSSSPGPNPAQGPHAPASQTQYQHPPRFSSASSNSSIAGNSAMQRVPTNSTLPRRSTSSRSTISASPTSYVALMRKQKATVWCDRAQHEDPRILAKHRKDKMRAAMIVAGGKHHGSSASTSSSLPGGSMGIRSKIRHQGAPRAHTYLGGANMSGAGVPIRLSATEVDENDSDEDYDSKHGKFNQRGGSGRSSNGSGGIRSNAGYTGSTLGLSNDASPPAAYSPPDSLGYDPDEQTPVPHATNMNQSDYFQGSLEDAEEEQNFGGLTGLPPSKPITEQDIKKAEELRRRGSVDDRTTTMSGFSRLFIANPDTDD